ncbi:MAG TPA: hypothetical protein PK642_03635 [Paludibacteraceae bacterium]|nr:hypothetical protein [Paludibacteraceae bacterium]HPO67420.1 hypothetical protein [Paludibacteraceae bacterium]
MIVDKIAKYQLKKEVKRYNLSTAREKRFINYDQARNFLLIFESDENEKNLPIKKIIEKLKSDDKKVTAIGYLNKKKLCTPFLLDYKIFNSRQTNFFKKPNEFILKELRNYQFDIVIDLSFHNVIPLQYVVLYVNAFLKVGLKNADLSIYDFIFNITNQFKEELSFFDNINNIFNQIIFYLKNIQSSD